MKIWIWVAPWQKSSKLKKTVLEACGDVLWDSGIKCVLPKKYNHIKSEEKWKEIHSELVLGKNIDSSMHCNLFVLDSISIQVFFINRLLP